MSAKTVLHRDQFVKNWIVPEPCYSAIDTPYYTRSCGMNMDNILGIQGSGNYSSFYEASSNLDVNIRRAEPYRETGEGGGSAS